MSGLDDVLAAFAALLHDYEATEVDPGPGEGNFRCVDCRACYGCRFCVSCEGCEECTYCEGCVECTRCTQSQDARGCEDCTHVDHSRDCVRCHYVTLSVACEDCVQCFACVGLSGEEFCILNERHSRRSYLEKVAELRAELEQRRQSDRFRPAIHGPLADGSADLPAEAPQGSPQDDGDESTNPQNTADETPGLDPTAVEPGMIPVSETTGTGPEQRVRLASLMRGARPGPRPGERTRAAPARPTSLVAGRRPDRPAGPSSSSPDAPDSARQASPDDEHRE